MLWYGSILCSQVTKVLCSFHVLSVLIDSNFLKPQIDGTHIDEHNVTYQLQDCVPTDRGPVCNGLVRAVKPCLLTHAINVCHFTVFPVANYSVLYKIQSQRDLICMELPSPFVGCIEYLEVLFWFDEVFFLFWYCYLFLIATFIVPHISSFSNNRSWLKLCLLSTSVIPQVPGLICWTGSQRRVSI